MDETFITLHRKITKSACFQDADLLKVFIWCLVKANFKDREVIHGGQLINLKRGQFITGRFVASEELKMSEKKYRNRLDSLMRLNQIQQKGASKYTIISVVNYDYYQSGEEKRASKGPAKGQQRATDNKDNKVNNNTPTEKIDMSFQNQKRYSEDRGYEEKSLQSDPDYKPAKKKEQGKATDDMQAVFELFNNPAKVTWRMREIERVSAQALFDTYGLETIKKRVDRIEKLKITNSEDPFLPQVDTPSELLDKMPKVERYIKTTSS